MLLCWAGRVNHTNMFSEHRRATFTEYVQHFEYVTFTARIGKIFLKTDTSKYELFSMFFKLILLRQNNCTLKSFLYPSFWKESLCQGSSHTIWRTS